MMTGPRIKNGLREISLHMRDQVKKGILSVDRPFSTSLAKLPYPEGMNQYTARDVRFLLERAGFLTPVSKGETQIHKSLMEYSVDDIVATSLEVEQHRETGAPRGRNGSRKSEPQTEAPEAAEPEPEEEQFSQINVYEVIDALDDNEIMALIPMLLERIASRAPDLQIRLAAANADVERRDHDLEKLRIELKDAKVLIMQLRDDYARQRTHIAPQVVERIVTVDNKPIPVGMQHGTSSTGFGKANPHIAVGRKPLMNNAPKIVRKRFGLD